MNTSRFTEIKWGLIFIAMLLVWMVLERILGFHDTRIALHMYVTNLVMIPAITIYLLALKDKREKDLQGQMSWLQGFVSGLIIALVVAVFSPLTQYLISAFISPNYFANIIEFSVQQNEMTREEAEAYFNYQNYAIQSAIGAVVMGAITGAIVAIFVKKRAS